MSMLLMLGMGRHGKRMYHAFTLFEGGVSNTFPKKSRRPKRAWSSADQAQTNPIILKSVKECYHNPDPVAHLIGKANETKMLVNDVECLALVDSGVQLSTINIEFNTCKFLFLFDIIYMTQWSNFLNKQNKFLLQHILLPFLQQRLLQVYRKMSMYITGGVVMENFNLYYIVV